MRRAYQRNTNGFAFVELLMILAVLATVAAVGFYAYQRSHPTKSLTGNTASHETSTRPQRSTPDPYVGWKQYCSVYGGVCFKYPGDWVTSEGETYLPDQKRLTVTSPSGYVSINYSPADQGVGGACDPTVCFFDTTSLTRPLASNASGLTIVQGISSDISSSVIVPFYYVANSAQVARQGLVSGQNLGTGFLVTEFPNPNVDNGLEHIAVQDPSETSYSSVSAAKSWFSNPEVTTAGKVLSSLEYR